MSQEPKHREWWFIKATDNLLEFLAVVLFIEIVVFVIILTVN